jgi:hypothetical protein
MSEQPVPKELQSRYLGALKIEVERQVPLGMTPSGRRRFDILKGGSFEGPRLRGRLLPGGADSLVQNADDAFHPDVRLVLETDDGETVLITYRGIRIASDPVHQRLARNEVVPYTEFYLRNAPFFVTAARKYDWLNRILSIGVGRRDGPWVIYEVFEIL